MKVFFDTNVLISAFASHGACAQLFDLAPERFARLTSETVLVELEEKLATKFRFTAEEIADVLTTVRRFPVVPAAQVFPAVAIRDADDLPILAAALSAGADILVTGDGDLLVLEKVGALEILTPRQLLDRLAAAE